MKKLPFHLLLLFLFVLAYRASPVSFAAEEAVLDFGEITEEHLMVPMRDGVKLSVYLYRPAGDGPWPVIFEQRYASLRGKGTRESAAKLARSGYVVALVNYRGSHLSEGKWVGYRAMQFGGLRDGYDVCEWFAGRKARVAPFS